MHVNGNELDFVVQDVDLEDSPDWIDPQSSPPPMSTADAIRAARAELGRYARHPDQWTVSGIAIHRFQQHTRWFYVIEWRCNDKSAGDGIDIPVLMSGRAVTGNVKREAIKNRALQDSCWEIVIPQVIRVWQDREW